MFGLVQTTSPTQSGLVELDDCPEGFTCLQNRDFGDEDETSFSIDLSLEVVDPSNSEAYVLARNKMMQVITGNLPPRTIAGSSDFGDCRNGPPRDSANNVRIDDVYICGLNRNIPDPDDGNIRSARVTFTREVDNNFLAVAGEMTFDTDDIPRLVDNGTWEPVIEHEMLHILGIGSLWDDNNLFSSTEDDFNPYTGPAANNVWQTTWGCTGSPPIRTTGRDGTRGVHWSDACLINELMTGAINSGRENPFSELTVGSLEDIGYTVDYSAADEYDENDLAPGCCDGSSPIEGVPPATPDTPELSDAARNAAIAYGRQVLNESKRPDDILDGDGDADNGGLNYVGDREIVVLVEEGGIIYDVHVTSP